MYLIITIHLKMMIGHNSFKWIERKLNDESTYHCLSFQHSLMILIVKRKVWNW